MKGTTVIEPEPTESCKQDQKEKHKWIRDFHINFADKAVDTFHCVNCNEAVTRTYYRDDEDMMYWGDEESC